VAEAVVVVNLDGDSTAPIATCAVSNLTFESFVVICTSASPSGAELRYAVFVPAEPPAELQIVCHFPTFLRHLVVTYSIESL
jgi:hypothetical protein